MCAQPKGLQFNWGGEAGEYGIGEIQWEVIVSYSSLSPDQNVSFDTQIILTENNQGQKIQKGT